MTCPYCHHDRMVYVHGHGQCARCGINIEPCCDGGGCELPAESSTVLEYSKQPEHHGTPREKLSS